MKTVFLFTATLCGFLANAKPSPLGGELERGFCNAVMPTNIQEANLQEVYNIYIATWGVGLYEFTTTQKAALETIACKDPLLESDAVYMARVLLGEALPCSNYNKKGNVIMDDVDSDIHRNDTEKISNFKLYPNPNNGNMVLEYMITGNENGNLSIFAVDGREVYNAILQPSQNTLNINIESVPAGLYHYKITRKGELLKTDKIIVLE